MPNSSPRERPQTRTDWVEATLRHAILSGELPPGEKLLSADLEVRYNVSQTPVREALQRLSAAGLVELNAQQGARVAPVSTQDMFEIYEVRMLLEPVAIKRALRWAGTPSYLRSIETHFSELERALEKDIDDLWEFERVHREFHHALIAPCDSRRLLKVVEGLVDHSVRYQLLSKALRGSPDEVLKEHRQLYEAARSGDADRASDLIHRHLRLTVDSVVHTTSQPPPPEGDGPDSR